MKRAKTPISEAKLRLENLEMRAVPAVILQDGFETAAFDPAWSAVIGGENIAVENGVAHSGDFAVRMSYPTHGANASLNKYGLTGDEFYIRSWQMFPGGFTDNRLQMAALFQQTQTTYQGSVAVDLIGQADPATDRVQSTFFDGLVNPRSETADFAALPGQWFKTGVYVKYNTPGQSNGIYRLWRNDVLLVDLNNVEFRTTTQGADALLIGGGYDGAGVDPAFLERYVDDVYIATTSAGDIGTGNLPPQFDFIYDTVTTVGNGAFVPLYASDPNNDSVSFSLGADAPPGASIDSSSNYFSWNPVPESGIFRITVIATDNGTPSLSTSRTLGVIAIDNGRLRVFGTPQDDSFTLFAQDAEIIFNGYHYALFGAETQSPTSLVFDGLGGNDSATLHGSSVVDTVAIRAGGADYQTSYFPFAAINTETINFLGAPDDIAYLYDGPGDDIASVGPGTAQFTGPGFSNRVLGPNTVYAFSTAGGADTAYVQDSSADDTYYAFATYGYLLGLPNALSYFSGFRRTNVTAGPGNDTSYFYDTAGDDSFVNGPNYSYMTLAGGIVNYAGGFERTFGFASSGVDTASFFDTPGDDTFSARTAYTEFTGSNGQYNYAGGFDNAYGAATSGVDNAYLYDSSGNDSFFATISFGQMSLQGGGIENASGFDKVYGFASTGIDNATLYDSSGDDNFTSTANYSYIIGANGLYSYVSGFDQTTGLASTGIDIATFYDSSADDTFVATVATSTMSNAGGLLNRGTGFDRTYGIASIGNDCAYLYDSAGNDTFIATPGLAYIFGSTGLYNYASGFKCVFGYASAGIDDASFYDGRGDDVFVATSTYSELTASGIYSYASAFERNTAYASSGLDSAYFYDSAGDDYFVSTVNYSYTIDGTGKTNYASAFERSYGYATDGFDAAYLYDTAGNDTFVGTSAYSYISSSSLYYCYASGFDQSHAIATTGTDVASIYDTAGDDQFFATPTSSYLKNSAGLYIFAGNFDSNYGYASSGTDSALILDSFGDDSFTASGSAAIIDGPAYYAVITGCDQVTAESARGGTDRKFISSIDYALELIGPWS